MTGEEKDKFRLNDNVGAYEGRAPGRPTAVK
jgi:hypothetical protein